MPLARPAPTESWQPDVAGIERGSASGPYSDIACITSVAQTGHKLYYTEWDPSLAACAGGLTVFPPCLDSSFSHNTFAHPRIDANDDYGTNGGGCQSVVACEAFNFYTSLGGRWEVGIYDPPTYGAIPTTGTTGWIDVSGLPPASTYPSPAGGLYNHYLPAVAYGPNGGAEYMVTECAVPPSGGWGSGDFFMMTPVGCSGARAGSNFYEVNTVYPATSSNHANSVSTPCNNVIDSSLMAWTHGGSIYYKRTGFGYAYKPAPGATPQSNETFGVWPNPATDAITVSNAENAQRYSIVNMLGQVMQTGNMTVLRQDVDVSSLPAGSYIIHLYKNGMDTAHKMFVKK